MRAALSPRDRNDDPMTERSSSRKYKNCDLIIEASGTIGGLHLGDFNSTKDLDYIAKNKITCVLTVADCDLVMFPKGVVSHHKIIRADDVPQFKLNEFFKECFRFIHEHRNKGKSVLVHCMAGISRSATIVIGYMMTVYPTLTLESAFEHVRKRRRIIRPNDGFLDQLRDYDKQIQEKRKKKEKIL